jgi:hypothetical protein
MHAFDTREAHQSGKPLAADPNASIEPKFGMHARLFVAATQPPIQIMIASSTTRPRVPLRARIRWTLTPFVEAGW